MPILSNLIVRIGASTTDFDKQVDRSLGKVKRFAADVTAAGSALAIGFSAPLIAAGAAAIKAGSDMESLTMGLKAVMKTSEATAGEMAKLREVAKLPGLGLEEAVKGSIRLQILGNSAEASRRIMMEFGNALATVGGGRDDFDVVIKQLSDISAVGKLTKENLDPITERVPQVAAIMRREFGPDSLGEPAKALERLGIDGRQAIQIITDELAKGERAGNTYKNSWENIQMAAKDAAAEFGKTLLPVAQRVLDDFLTPGIEKAKALATAFRGLPQPTQDWSIAIGAVATALPLVIVALGTITEKAAVLAGAINKITPLIKTWAGGITLVGTAAVAAGAGVAYFLNLLNSNRQSTLDTTAESIKNINDKFSATPISAGAARDTVMAYMQVLKPTEAAVISTGEAHASAADKTEKHTEKIRHLAKVTLDSEILQRLYSEAVAAHAKHVEEATEVVRRYGAISVDAATRAAKALDLLFVSYRQLSDAPEIAWNKVAFGDIPKAQMPKFDGDFKEFERQGANIRPDGMLTKEQAEAVKGRYKDISKTGKAALQQVSLITNDLAKGITDVIFKGGKLGDMFVNVAKQAAQSITRLLIEGALTKLTSKLIDVGGLMGKVFGGGTGAIMSAAPGAASSAAGAAASAGGGAASAIGGVTSSLTGVVNAVGSVVSAVSSVIGNFQMAGMNKTLDLIEKEVRYSQIHLLHTLEKANEFWPYMKACWESLVRMETRQMAVGAGGAGVVINVNGGDPKQVLDEITRTLKQYGIIPKN